MRASTSSLSSAIPTSAFLILNAPSKGKGFVTTPTVSAPQSRASLAITGLAPVPVPPPIPAVTNTISAPSICSLIKSVDSSAALLPTSGLAPAPRPCVISCPIGTFNNALFTERS